MYMMPQNLVGCFIKHKYAKDVCYHVDKVSKLNGDYKYNLTIWNMGFEKSWKIDTCKVDNLDLSSFVYYPDVAECYRNVVWKEIE